MTVIPVRHLPDPVLREKTRRVTTITPAVRALVDTMIETMHVENGVGIAANQIGEKLRVAFIEIPEERDEEDRVVQEYARHVLINPRIVRRVGEREVDEGCLSAPGWRGTLTRSVRVTAQALDLDGKEVRIRATDLLAQALEHETDHLDGVAYIDRVESVDNMFPLVARDEDGEEAPSTENDQQGRAAHDPNIIWRLRRPVAPVVRRGR